MILGWKARFVNARCRNPSCLGYRINWSEYGARPTADGITYCAAGARVAAEKALPFEPLNPNAATVAAMKAACRGKLVKVGKPDRLLRSLSERDQMLDPL